MLRLPLSALSPAGHDGRLTILIFHRVLAEADPLFPEVPDRMAFESRMRWVRGWFNVLPLTEALDALYAGAVPARALAITFDDGYADNETNALPILKRLGLTATFFVSTGFLDGGCMWNDRIIEAIRTTDRAELGLASIGLRQLSLATVDARRRAIDELLPTIKHLEPERRLAMTEAIAGIAGATSPPTPMMTREQVRSLQAGGMTIGAHTVNHPILKRIDRRSALDEMSASKIELERLIGSTVDLFAYPNGVPDEDYGAEHAAMVRECGFRAAVTTAPGAASMRSDRYQLPRFAPWDRTRLRYGFRLLANLQRRPERVAA